MAGMPKMDADTETTLKQFKEFLLSYNKLSEMCFNDCVHDFTTRKVIESEASCSNYCMEKYMKMTQRISQRFQEVQMQTNEGILSKTGIVG